MIYICIRELYSVFFNNNKFSICSYDEEVNHMLMVLNEYTGERVHAPARLNKQFISFLLEEILKRGP